MSPSARLTIPQNVKKGISPAGEFLLQRCKRNQKTAGGGSRAFHNALSRLPRTPIYFTGEPPRGFLSPSGASKRQDTVPRAARCRSVLVEQACSPTRTIAPTFPPSRGGLVITSPPWLVPDVQDYRKHAPAPGPHPPAVSLIAIPFQHVVFQVTVPRGVHPIGGPRPP